MTRYTYNTQTFRLSRQRSEKYIRTHLNGMITYAYDPGTNKQDDAFNYDLVGNILNILSSKTACGIGGTNQLNRQFSYDPLYRLTSATGRENVPGSSYPFPGWEDFTRSTDPNTTTAYTRNYKYDKLGNIQQLQHIGSTNFTREFSYAANTNKLDELNIGANSYNYTYDACGNQLTSNTERKFEWDAANKLLCFRNQAGSSEPSVIAQYLYDSAGNRTKKIVRKQGGIFEIRTYIDGIFEFFTDETEEQNTIHIMDDMSRIATIRLGYNFDDTTPPIKYVLENNIGSSMLLLDDVGAPVNAQEYYPFGETSFGSYAKKRYQYTGKERDEESGLYYYGARYYAAWCCRFISIDPLASKYPNLSGYLYAYNNPIMMNDPTGMEGEKGGEDKNNLSNSDANDKIPTIKQSEIPKGSKPLSQDAALHNVKNKGNLHKEGRLVKVENPGGGHFYYSTPEGKNEGAVDQKEDEKIKNNEENVESAVEIEKIEENGEITKQKNESSANNNNLDNQKSKLSESKGVYTASKNVGTLGSKMLEVAAESTLEDINKFSPTTIKNSSKNKPSNKILNKIKKLAKNVGRFIGGLSMVETITSIAVDLAKTGKLIWSNVVKLSLETIETFSKLSGPLSFILTLSGFVFWKTVWPSLEELIDDKFEPWKVF